MKLKLMSFLLGAFLSCAVFSDETTDIGTTDVGATVRTEETEQKDTFQRDIPKKDAYHSIDPYHFSIQMKNYRFSTFFEIDSDDTYVGNIKKSIFRLCDHYDLSDRDGWCATGIRRVFSLGSLFKWAAEIDILGVSGESLGFIEGKILTTAKAKFYIYDRNTNLVGIAYMDLDNKGVTICPPDNETYPLARLNRVYVPDIHDHWEVHVYEPQNLDDRIVRIFAAFCVDVEDAFHEDI
jgi:hypothetical protein